MSELLVKWNTGRLCLNVEEFFPCSESELKKLLKIIEMDWEHRDSLILQIEQLFELNIQRCEEMFKGECRYCIDAKQKAADLKSIVESQKMPNGLPVSGYVLKEYQKQLKKAEEEAKELKKSVSSIRKLKEKYKKLLEMLRKRK